MNDPSWVKEVGCDDPGQRTGIQPLKSNSISYPGQYELKVRDTHVVSSRSIASIASSGRSSLSATTAVVTEDWFDDGLWIGGVSRPCSTVRLTATAIAFFCLCNARRRRLYVVPFLCMRSENVSFFVRGTNKHPYELYHCLFCSR